MPPKAGLLPTGMPALEHGMSKSPKLSVSDMELGPGTDTMNPKLPLPTGAENSLNANGSQGMLAKSEPQSSVLCILVAAPEQERVK